MAGLLSSWWSGKAAEGEREEGGGEEREEGEGERDKEEGSSWVSGLEGIVKNVTEYAVTVGETVRNRVQDTQPMSFVSEFREEQERFARERQRLRDAAVPPWVGYQEEEQMKAQILELSADSRNVLRNPPPGVQFHFDFAKSYPVAMAMLKEDSRLQKLRFDLVPKKVTEEKFWHNFFYRVFLIKQSSQLSSLANEQKESVSSDPAAEQGNGDGGEGGEVAQSPGQEEFASDALPTVSSEISRETVQVELGQLGVVGDEGGCEDESSVWEEQLQQELQDMELQGVSGEGEGGGGEEVDPEAWEAELQEMLDMHSEPTTQS